MHNIDSQLTNRNLLYIPRKPRLFPEFTVYFSEQRMNKIGEHNCISKQSHFFPL